VPWIRWVAERRKVPRQERLDVLCEQPRRVVRGARFGRSHNGLVLGGFRLPGRRALPGGRGSPVRIACLIASSTTAVRDGTDAATLERKPEPASADRTSDLIYDRR
jgi:hypothetical protein